MKHPVPSDDLTTHPAHFINVYFVVFMIHSELARHYNR